jgi:deoxyadenosine/deoxycytidine kinase
MVTISIEGNIGAGKSTLLRSLQAQGYKVHFEQIDKWPLDEFYTDPKRWALALQLAIMKSIPYPTEEFVLYERSPLSAMNVFWDMLVETGVVEPIEDEIMWHYAEYKMWTPDVIIYIDCPPTQCFENIKNRHQVGDSRVTLKYIKQVENYYKKIPITHTVPYGPGVEKRVKDIIDEYK